jgi:hypothetical protein
LTNDVKTSAVLVLGQWQPRLRLAGGIVLYREQDVGGMQRHVDDRGRTAGLNRIRQQFADHQLRIPHDILDNLRTGSAVSAGSAEGGPKLTTAKPARSSGRASITWIPSLS